MHSANANLHQLPPKVRESSKNAIRLVSLIGSADTSEDDPLLTQSAALQLRTCEFKLVPTITPLVRILLLSFPSVPTS